MSEQVVRAMMSQLGAVVKANENATIEMTRVLRSLEELPAMLSQQSQALERALGHQTRAMAEMEMAQFVADMQSVTATSGSQKSLLDRVAADLAEEVAEVNERYRKLQQELDAVAGARVASMDAEALALMETHLMALRSCYASQLLPDLEVVQGEPAESEAARREALADAAHDLRQVMASAVAADAGEMAIPERFVSQASEGAEDAVLTLVFKTGATAVEILVEDPQASAEWSSFLIARSERLERLRSLPVEPIPEKLAARIVERTVEQLSGELGTNASEKVREALARKVRECLSISIAPVRPETTV